MKTVCILAMMLLCLSVATAKETFFSALESKAEVEKEGGTVDGGSFVPGKFGNGFISEKVGDVIHYMMQTILQNVPDESAATTGSVKRKRTLTGSALTKILVFGWLENPDASYQHLADAAATIGIPVS